MPLQRRQSRADAILIGSAAYRQMRLDAFGELMDELHEARQAGIVAAVFLALGSPRP